MGKNVVHAVSFLLIGALFSKLIGFVRELVFIHKFGVSSISDAYLLTCSIPEIFFTALSIAINMNFIPMYMELKKEEDQNRFASNLLNICILFAVSVCVLINLFPYRVLFLFAFSLPDETLRYAIVMLRIVSVSMIPILAERLFQAYSQANESFFSTALLGIITNLVLIVTYLITTEETFFLLSIGFLFAQLILMILMFFNAKRVGFRYNLVLDFKDASVKNMVLLSIPLTIGQIAEEASLLVDRNLAAQVGTGVISAMSYASLLSKFSGSMVMNAITTAIFPKLSQFVSERNKNLFSEMFWKYIRILNFALCPIAVFICVFSDDIVMILLHHGAIRESDARMIWECTSCYAIGIIPLGIQNYCVRGFYAFRETKIPTYIVLFSLVINIILSIILSANYGYIGITASTSVSYFVSAIGLIVVLIKKYKINGLYDEVIAFISCFLITALIGASVYFMIKSNMFSCFDDYRLFIEMFLFVFLYSLFLHKKSFFSFLLRNR